MRLALQILAYCFAAMAAISFTPTAAFGMDEGDDDQPRCLQVTWQAVAADCDWTLPEYTETSSSQPSHTWVTTIQCANGGICAEHIECVENGVPGFWHDIFRDGIDVGDVCMPEDAVDQVDVVQLILREFKRMSWPESRLLVQPRGGKTLVNLPTNFYTDEHSPVSRTVTIAKRRVEIRATPITYTFHFGDGDSLASSSPGRPHPNLDVTHTYASVDDVAVSLDTTYSGEYRIGDGDWTPMDVTLTVAGEEQGLAVVEALPQLVVR